MSAKRRRRDSVARLLRGLLPSTARPASRAAARHAGDDYGAPGSPDWRAIDWSEHVRDLEIEGRRVRYVELGEGSREPIVFIHGLAGCWQNWLENIPHAARERRAIALDLPGFGDSEMPRERISISGWARIVDSLCERLGVGPVAVVGNSMGGFIAAELAIAFPARVERLVLVSAAGISQTSLRRRPAVTIARGHAIVGARAVARRHDLVARPRLRHAVLSFVIRHPTLLSPEIVYEVLHGVGKNGFLPAMEALTTYDFRERLPEIGCPTLIVWGREDMVVPLADGLEFERLLADSRMLTMEDTGHVPMLERAPTFNRALSEFLAEASSVERTKAAAA